MVEPELSFYGEFLPNVSTLTGSIWPIDKLPAHLALLNRSQFYVKQNDSPDSVMRYFELPANVVKDQEISLLNNCMVDIGTNVMTFRIKAERQHDRRPHDVVQVQVPLSAVELTQAAAVECGNGHELFVRGLRFLDLPSENWHELLDYWHCHKPEHEHHGNHGHNHHHHDYHDNNDNHGSSAISKEELYPRESLGLVGSAYLTTVLSDIPGTKVRDREVECKECGMQLGTLHKKNNNVAKIYKWNMKLQGQASPAKFEVFISAILLGIIGFHASYHFTFANSSDKDSPRVLVWVFNTDVTYATSETDKVNRAIKVLYDLAPEPALIEKVQPEAIDFAEKTVTALIESLQKTNDCLPDSMKRFDTWQVGLLCRM
ncbi:ubiquitin-conjugating enzyme E2-binding protein [Lipomyces japonicus]|uniref:ubiquitin-conjugating enzyme E2-binding protein n=1 Tax=Lipomyces japonicus TaxID=56871 RepID=UPI0034CD2E01